MRSPRAAGLAAVGLGAGLAVVVGVALAGPRERPASEVTRYVAQLRSAAALAEQAAAATGGLTTRSCSQVGPAASKLAAAADAAKAAFQRYRSAQTRYGTREEIELITTVALKLREAKASLAKAAGGPAPPPSDAERRAAEREVSLFQALVAQKVEDRLQVEGLADVLASRSFGEMKGKVTAALNRRLRDRAEAELKRLTGLRIRLGVPLKQQVRDFLEAELSRALSKLVVAAGPAGIVISLVAGKFLNPGKLVELVGEKLKQALRNRGDVERRARDSVTGLEALRRQLNVPKDTRVDKVRASVRAARRELGRTKFLESDLERAIGRTKDAKTRQERRRLLAELEAARKSLQRTIDLAAFRFLLDSDLVGEDFRIAIAFAATVRADADRLARKLGCPLPAGGGEAPAAKGGPPTLATCPPPFTMEYFSISGQKLGEFEVTGPKLTRVYPNDSYFHKCLYFNPADKGENFVVFISTVPPNVPGRPASGDCARTNASPFASEKRHVTVGGGTRREGNRAVGGDGKILLQALALAEAQGVGRACK